jgi:hypothetical protein
MGSFLAQRRFVGFTGSAVTRCSALAAWLLRRADEPAHRFVELLEFA